MARLRWQRVLRTALELAMAFSFLVVAAECYAHRTFDADPRYRLLMTWLAVLILWLGLLPLLHHLSSRLGRVAFLVWLASVLLLAIAGVATRP